MRLQLLIIVRQVRIVPRIDIRERRAQLVIVDSRMRFFKMNSSSKCQDESPARASDLAKAHAVASRLGLSLRAKVTALVTTVLTAALTLFTVFYLPLPALAGVEQAEPLEKIVARVGNYPILISELATQVQLLAMQTGFKPTSQSEVDNFQEEVLQQLINEKLFLIAAQQDTTLRVTEQEITQDLNRQIEQISARFPDEETFLQALAEEGMTVRELKRKFYPEIENRILKDKFVSRKLSSISVSRQEVTEFYNEFRDSIPNQPASIRIAHILLRIVASDETANTVRDMARRIRKKAVAGDNFDDLIRVYSGPGGGDLGYLRREEVTPEFASAAFALRIGDISGAVRTGVGYHIFKCIARSGDSINVKQIFFPVNSTPADTIRTRQLADSLIQELRNGASFAEFAKEFSSDDDTRRTEGELGWYALHDLPEEFKVTISEDTQVGDIVGPAESAYGFHIIKVLEKRDARNVSLENSYDQIRELARRRKTDELISQWVNKRKKDTFIEIRSFK